MGCPVLPHVLFQILLALRSSMKEREGGITYFNFPPQDLLTNTLMVLLIPGLRLISHLDAPRQQHWLNWAALLKVTRGGTGLLLIWTVPTFLIFKISE